LRRGKISAIWAGDDWTAILFYTGTPWIPDTPAVLSRDDRGTGLRARPAWRRGRPVPRL
jgi:hypothetical protein